MNRRVQALVLRRIPYGDTSLVLHVYSREEGRLGLMGKGVRRPRQGLDAVLQTGHLVELQLLVREGRDLQLLKEADLVDDFRGLRTDYARLMSGLAVVEALEHTQLPEHADPVLFDTAAATLRLAAGDCPRPQNLIYWFLLFLLTHSGYGLDLAACAVCGRPWEDFRRLAGGGLDAREGRARCPDCRSGREEAALTPALWRVLHFLLHRPPDEVAGREITAETRRQLGELLALLLRAHLAPGLDVRSLAQAWELETTTTNTRERNGREDA
ncbi:MAG: DNA repair protein RecO [bacterium]|jgi:DNA repair protein RecO (recombination protein O)|nr:DNA repair protein RecO [bacterium]